MFLFLLDPLFFAHLTPNEIYLNAHMINIRRGISLLVNIWACLGEKGKWDERIKIVLFFLSIKSKSIPHGVFINIRFNFLCKFKVTCEANLFSSVSKSVSGKARKVMLFKGQWTDVGCCFAFQGIPRVSFTWECVKERAAAAAEVTTKHPMI